ncbi:phage tail assembly protein [Sphingomonas sp. R1]|uniref:phage tail assembly protein n=1 Tax=Sphingomonas sp. R1 TaxID=399176 RepID=UPI0022259B24|nr:phage tail assembly protein [Sphingomonas sp. R1]UYY78416.1 phage tail assembly protein [Sphingomonas sp. R1]
MSAITSSFILDEAITVGGEEKIAAGTTITVRKPGSGELRGLALQNLLQLDVASLQTLAPRITAPVLLKPFVDAMAPSDLLQFGTEVVDFLLPKAAKPASPTT